MRFVALGTNEFRFSRKAFAHFFFNGTAFFPSQARALAKAFFRAPFAFPLAQRVSELLKANFGGLRGVLRARPAAPYQQGRWTPRLECDAPRERRSAHQCHRVAPYIAGVMVRQKSLRRNQPAERLLWSNGYNNQVFLLARAQQGNWGSALETALALRSPALLLLPDFAVVTARAPPHLLVGLRFPVAPQASGCRHVDASRLLAHVLFVEELQRQQTPQQPAHPQQFPGDQQKTRLRQVLAPGQPPAHQHALVPIRVRAVRPDFFAPFEMFGPAQQASLVLLFVRQYLFLAFALDQFSSCVAVAENLAVLPRHERMAYQFLSGLPSLSYLPISSPACQALFRREECQMDRVTPCSPCVAAEFCAQVVQACLREAQAGQLVAA